MQRKQPQPDKHDWKCDSWEEAGISATQFKHALTQIYDDLIGQLVRVALAEKNLEVKDGSVSVRRGKFQCFGLQDGSCKIVIDFLMYPGSLEIKKITQTRDMHLDFLLVTTLRNNGLDTISVSYMAQVKWEQLSISQRQLVMETLFDFAWDTLTDEMNFQYAVAEDAVIILRKEDDISSVRDIIHKDLFALLTNYNFSKEGT